MEENKPKEMKTIEVNIWGIEKFLDAQDAYGDGDDARARFVADCDLHIEVDGKEYSLEDFECDCGNEPFEGYEEIDAAKFFEESFAEKGMLYVNKASSYFDIEIPVDEEFDPDKVTLVCRDFIYPDGSDESMLCAFVYDGKVYDCCPMDSVGKSGELIWKSRKGQIEYANETASAEQLADADKLPVLVFRYQPLSYCYEPGDEFDADDYPDFDGPGVVSAVNDDDLGDVFITENAIEYINSEEMVETLDDEGITEYDINLAATEKDYILLNSADKPDMLETIAAIWENSHEHCEYSPAFDKLIFRAIYRDTDDYARNEDYLLDNGKVYDLPSGKFDEIISGLSEEDQALNKAITPFGEYEED